MKELLILFIGFSLFACDPVPKTENNLEKTGLTLESQGKETTDFDASKFIIQKGRLGEIKIGMTISEAEKTFSGLSKKAGYATDFGFGGGSPAYLYYSGDALMFGLIPKLDTDTLLFIIAANGTLQTTNKLNPNSSIGELMQKYPKLTVQQDLMNSWEFFQDEKNGWDFVFMTDEKTEIGEYSDITTASKPKRFTTKTDWITIR